MINIMIFKYVTFVVVIFLSISRVNADTVVGILYSDMNLKLAMGDSGLINKVLVKSGSVVKKGQALLLLDNSMHDLEVLRSKLVWLDKEEQRSLTKRHELLSHKYDVAYKLYHDSRSVSLDEIDGLRMELIDLEGRIGQLEEREKLEELDYKIRISQRDKRVLRAPVDGVITQVIQHPGEWAQAGDPIVGLVELSELVVKLNIRDKVARELNVDAKLPVHIENLEPRVGVVEYIAPVADTASGMVEIKIRVDNSDGGMRPGVKVTVDLQSKPSSN